MSRITKAQLEAENKVLREQNRNLRIFNKIIRNQLVVEVNNHRLKPVASGYG